MQEHVESQLSAMFDGELPPAECELLSRRIDRDEKLRARWSRYALIGAAMRSEPVATARSGFAGRVSVALDGEPGIASAVSGSVSRAARARASAGRTVWNTALAASMVVAVAGVSIAFLRYSVPDAGRAGIARTGGPVGGVSLPMVAAAASAIPVSVAATNAVGAVGTTGAVSDGEPRSYVTPVNQTASHIGLQTELADFMVAHSEYSTSLMRRSLLSALVSSEEMAEVPVSQPIMSSAGQSDALPAASAAGR